MMKGTPCSRYYAPLKTSSKTRISIEVQGLGPVGFGAAPQPCLLHRSMVRVLGMPHTQHQSREAGSTAKMSRINPQAYLADVLNRIADHPIRQIDTLLPWRWAK